MKWEAPSCVEIKMDSEINSYQDDFRDDADARDSLQSMPSSGVIANPPNTYGSI
ncbi:hypothetical protein YTPLAS72_01510 [Nitrospira sp.]|nr:hypothetical protein YTPLAS72_01510 [Nitrospira sp.]